MCARIVHTVLPQPLFAAEVAAADEQGVQQQQQGDPAQGGHSDHQPRVGQRPGRVLPVSHVAHRRRACRYRRSGQVNRSGQHDWSVYDI